MSHDRFGWWIRDAWRVRPQESTASVLGRDAFEPLTADASAKVVVVGGGFTGMWAALELLNSVSPHEIVILEAGICGVGPSGRNGGFCDSFVEAAPRLVSQLGVEKARSLVGESIANISRIGEWEAEFGDFNFKQAGQLIAVAGKHQQLEDEQVVSAIRALGLPEDTATALDGKQARKLCDSETFQHGLYLKDTATLHPGKLAHSLRFALMFHGVQIFESSPVKTVSSNAFGVEVTLHNGAKVKAERGILAAGVASAGFGGMEREVTMTSSHIVVTEPIPEQLNRLNWKDGLAVTDARYLVHYFRTTADNRILFGWGGGRIAKGVQPTRQQSMDWKVVSQTIKDLRRFFPIPETVRIESAWGGPIDASPTHMPALREFADGWVAAFGYTGNGVGPSKLLGDAMAAISLNEFAPTHPVAPLLVNDPLLLPPDPFRRIGGSFIRKGLDRVERRGEKGKRAPLWAKGAASIPERLGYRIGR